MYQAFTAPWQRDAELTTVQHALHDRWLTFEKRLLRSNAAEKLAHTEGSRFRGPLLPDVYEARAQNPLHRLWEAASVRLTFEAIKKCEETPCHPFARASQNIA